jgi:hypothetical protein
MDTVLTEVAAHLFVPVAGDLTTGVALLQDVEWSCAGAVG